VQSCAVHFMKEKEAGNVLKFQCTLFPTAKSLQWLRLADTAYASATAHGRQAAAGLLITLCVLSPPHSITRSPPPLPPLKPRSSAAGWRRRACWPRWACCTRAGTFASWRC